MNKKYFKITPANAADIAQLRVILSEKTFYPEATSTPALPVSYNIAFDYRQFFILVGYDKDGNAIVFTRKEYTTGEFAVNVIPTADWTGRYYMSIAPTITALPTYNELDVFGHSVKTNINAFQSYQYMS